MTEQTFSFETVACLLAVLEDNKITLGNKHYELMAKLDGKRSHHGFQHLFRKVKSRAKELQGELDTVKTTTPSTATKKSAGKDPTKTSKATAKTPSKGKGGSVNKRGRSEECEGGDEQEPAFKKLKPEPVEDEEEFFRFVIQDNMLTGDDN